MSNIKEDIQRQTKSTINYYKDLEKIEEIPIDILRAMYKDVLAERKRDKERIQELEEENRIYALEGSRVKLELYIKENYIQKQKVKDVLTEIREEYNKVQEQFDCIWNKKSKDDYDRYKLQELSAMQQELGFILGKLEELLEESK